MVSRGMTEALTVKEVQTAKLRLPVLRASRHDVLNEERRRIGRKDAVRARLLIKECEEVLLQLEVLDDSLDDEVRALDSLLADISSCTGVPLTGRWSSQ